MAYGRLDVYWPDGLIKTFPLSQNNVSVGRSSGNTIMLENSTISRYHFNITRETSGVFLIDLDSANGTYIDGVKLASGERRELDGGEEIQIGNLRIIFHAIEETATQRIVPIEDTTQRVELSIPEFSIDLQAPDQACAPGSHVSAELQIVNTSDTDQRYVIEVTGPPKEWVRIDRPTPFVDAKDTTFVLVNFKPQRRSDSKPGDYIVTVRVYPQEKPTAVIETTLMLRVKAFGSIRTNLEQAQLRMGERFRLNVQNQGSSDLPVSIIGRDRRGNLQFEILAPRATLMPGQKLTIQGEVRPKRRAMFGSTRQHPFDLMVHAHNNAGYTIPMRGYLIESPALPGWLLLALSVTAGLVVLALIVGLLLLARTPAQPSFADMSVSSLQISQGDPLEISWQATDVAQVNITLNATPVATITSPNTTSFTVDTTGYTGEVTIQLEGINGDRADYRSQRVLIYPPLAVAQFEVTPPQLVRHVIGSVNIAWSVPGALSTQIMGLESFNSTPIVVDGSEGSVADLVGVASDPMTLVLIAQGIDGQTLQETFTINVVNPECRAARDNVTLYSGPSTAYQVVATVPRDTVIVVDAQDQSGQWLRVPNLSGGLVGWGMVSEFACNSNFSVAELIKDINVTPLPPTAPPPTLTQAPTTAVRQTPLAALTPTDAG